MHFHDENKGLLRLVIVDFDKVAHKKSYIDYYKPAHAKTYITHDVNSGSEMVEANHFFDEDLFHSTSVAKNCEEKFFTSHTLLLIQLPYSNDKLANQAGFYGAC